MVIPLSKVSDPAYYLLMFSIQCVRKISRSLKGLGKVPSCGRPCQFDA